MNAFRTIVGPLITEKAESGKETHRTLCFKVRPEATKTDIKNAVQHIFKVKVDEVRTANFPGKLRRRGKFAGYRSDWKKAYVKLKAGEKMIEYAQI